jgi:hypothetical protein
MTTEQREVYPAFIGNLNRNVLVADVKNLFEKKGLKVTKVGASLSLFQQKTKKRNQFSEFFTYTRIHFSFHYELIHYYC